MQEKLEPMYELNPLLYCNKEKYIWYGHSMEDRQRALNLFVKLCQLKIYIHGFVSDFTSYVGLKIFNKKVVSTEYIDGREAYVFTDQYEKKGLQPIYVLNSKIKETKCVVYGAGANGKIVKDLLGQNKIEVLFYIDSNPEKEGMKVGGAVVYGAYKLSELDAETIIIEASDNYAEMDQVVEKNCDYIKRFYYSKIIFEVGNERWIDNKKNINVFEILTMTQMFLNKSIFIYGVDDKCRNLAAYLTLLDFDFGGFLCDFYDNQVELLDEYRVLNVEEVLYEKHFFVLVDRKRKNSIRKIEEMGLRFAEDFGCMYPLCHDTLYKRKTRLDVLLGHTFVGECEYPGFCINGDEKGYRIVTLGGSTTDGSLYSFSSWPELLQRKCKKKLTIYNGGCGGYLSSHDLLKLIRDVLVLNPDMVIAYSGFNDTVHLPFDFEYSNKVFSVVANMLDESWNIDDLEDEESVVQFGLKRKDDKFSLWLSNIRMMNAICKENGILFYAFLQPMLASKYKRDKKEEEIFLQCWPAYTCNREADMKFFRERMSNKKIKEENSYIFDLSHIFDNTTDVYMDHCHVFRKGNEMIADEILKKIYNSIP